MKTVKQLAQKVWVKMFWFVARRLCWEQTTIVGARTTVKLNTENTQVTLIVWDLTNPKYAVLYSREELVGMLGVVRQCEREMGWKVPEPEMTEAVRP